MNSTEHIHHTRNGFRPYQNPSRGANCRKAGLDAPEGLPKKAHASGFQRTSHRESRWTDNTSMQPNTTVIRHPSGAEQWLVMGWKKKPTSMCCDEIQALELFHAYELGSECKTTSVSRG